MSIRAMLAGVVLIACFMAIARTCYLFVDSTVYSTGYDEDLFRRVRVGMTTEEVEDMLGPPLSKPPWPDHGCVNWAYTDSGLGPNFHKRWLYMEDGKVATVLCAYWVD